MAQQTPDDNHINNNDDDGQGDGDRQLSISRTNEEEEDSNNTLVQTPTNIRTIGRFKLRGKTDDLPQDWWFASTAIPLLAATIGPLANVLSIAALVTKWKVTLPNNGQLPEGTDDNGVNLPDPRWEIILNGVSLILGFFGNFFLLLNFTRRIRYIVALPVTVISWYFATGILTGIIVALNQYDPPIRPGETYSQGFWYAIIAAVLYLIGSMLLMVNMLGYFLGHYPQHFDLTDDQRTLILQTMLFFFWLAGGAAVFSAVCDFTYANALYFCDVTVLTVGFGDIVPTNDAGRGLVLPYSVMGIIFLGLMINSIRKFAINMSKDKVIRRHTLNERERTFGRTVTNEKELRERLGLPPKSSEKKRPQPGLSRSSRASLEQVGHFEKHGRTIVFKEEKSKPVLRSSGRGGAGRTSQHKTALSRDAKMQERASGRSKIAQRAGRREKLLILREERDRFNAMRDIQSHTSRFKQYYALSLSVLAFGILWCVGAAVFMVAEARIQALTYFEALYFCYVSLLTIGYGDFSPQSNAGKPFFVIWSLMAVPTMTILVSDMGDTVVSAVNRGTFTLADWTVMPKRGVWHDFLVKHPRFREWVLRKGKERKEKKNVERGFVVQNPDDEEAVAENTTEPSPEETERQEETRLKELVREDDLNDHELARRLAKAIKRVANDLSADKPRKYSYEEWVEFTRLIRFSSKPKRRTRLDEDGEEVVTEEEGIGEEEERFLEWDWIGEDSPMLAEVTESEWVLDRLCESLNRYTREQAREAKLAQQNHRHNQHHNTHFMLTAPTFPISHPSDGKKNNNLNHRSHSPSSMHSLDGHISDQNEGHTTSHYPSHPGPRRPGKDIDYHHTNILNQQHRGRERGNSISPVLSRGPSGVEIVKLGGRSRSKSKSRERLGDSMIKKEGQEGGGTSRFEDGSSSNEEEHGLVMKKGDGNKSGGGVENERRDDD